MKRIISVLLCLILICASLSFASADTVPAGISAYLSSHKTYDGYKVESTVDYSDIGYYFVMLRSGSNHMLVVFKPGKDGNWAYWTRTSKAIPQGDTSVTIDAVDVDGADGLYVTYEKGSTNKYYAWKYGKSTWNLYYMYLEDSKDSVMIDVRSTSLTYTNAKTRKKIGTANGTVQTDLRYVNLSGFPTTLKTAKSKLTAPPVLPYSNELNPTSVKFTGGKKYEVYSGPGSDYVRSVNSKGKGAVVSTNDWIEVFGYENGYIMIEYAISKDQMRFGYIKEDALPKNADVDRLWFNDAVAVVLSDTFVTDDPLFTMGSLAKLSAGTEVIWLGTMGDWAYVEDSARKVRGFVKADLLDMNDEYEVEFAE
ncbi:MAG: hypothetical protein MJ142_07190 [Clostridia bacterium]|nr:hypothetical protein [Clostridia bacterium]